MDIIQTILTAFKGYFTYTEVSNMDANVRHLYYIRAIEKLSSDDGRKQIAAEQLQEALEEGVSK